MRLTGQVMINLPKGGVLSQGFVRVHTVARKLVSPSSAIPTGLGDVTTKMATFVNEDITKAICHQGFT